MAPSRSASSTSRGRAGWRRGERGQSLAELGLLLPVLLLLLAGGADLARVYYAGNEAADAAREAALYASHHAAYTAADLTRVANGSTGSAPLRCSTLIVSVPPTVSGPAGATREQPVNVECDINLLTPILFAGNPIKLTTTASGLVGA